MRLGEASGDLGLGDAPALLDGVLHIHVGLLLLQCNNVVVDVVSVK